MPQEQVPEPVPGVRDAAEVAQMFDDAHIPYVLWGWLAFSLAGQIRQKACTNLQFVISNHHIGAAAAILDRKGIHACKRPACLTVAYEEGEKMHTHNPCIALFAKSDILSWLPDYGHGLPDPHDPHLMLSNDPRLPPANVHELPGPNDGPSGPWRKFRRIKVLNPNALTEAVLSLYARHRGHPCGGPDPPGFRLKFEILLVGYYLPSLYEKGGRDAPEHRRHLRPPFQLAWDYLNGRRPAGHDKWVGFYRLRNYLIDVGEIPVTLPRWDRECAGYAGWDELKAQMG
ncbi:hypothetical protein BDW74DRAFT_183576 [Aspergillus multicolor]|uniref:uncharacterized protein n=1 Tax=Aspergillus multicolor TaxID=41759 RepID=UPI003CCE0C9C